MLILPKSPQGTKTVLGFPSY